MGVWGVNDESVKFIYLLIKRINAISEYLNHLANLLINYYEANNHGLGRHADSIGLLVEELSGIVKQDSAFNEISRRLERSAMIRAAHLTHSYQTNIGDRSSFTADAADLSSQSSQSSETQSSHAAKMYTMEDIKNLKNTDHFANNSLEHIFDGTINGKGKATGYHYSMVTDSKCRIIDGTRSKTDEHGVFTGKVEGIGVEKNGFSSFYPESWSPQQVVDAINEAYDDALKSPDNPQGSLWIGYSGDLEIDMYLNSNKQIITAYPVYEGD